jgi:uncharacterized membrane protein
VPDTVGERVNGLVVAMGLGDLVYETEVETDFVKGLVVAIPVFETVCVIDLVNGLDVAIGLGDLEYVGDFVYDTDVEPDFVNGLVVAIAVFERVSVTD